MLIYEGSAVAWPCQSDTYNDHYIFIFLFINTIYLSSIVITSAPTAHKNKNDILTV